MTSTEQLNDDALVESWRPYFEAEYARDPAQHHAPALRRCWRWVKTYLLDGGSGYPGWLPQGALLAQVRDARRRGRGWRRCCTIPASIAGEWAKKTAQMPYYLLDLPAGAGPNLMEWGRTLQRRRPRHRRWAPDRGGRAEH
ncbi:MAG: hypothetical protein U0Z44_04415 [Kouleothrix sp.]